MRPRTLACSVLVSVLVGSAALLAPASSAHYSTQGQGSSTSAAPGGVFPAIPPGRSGALAAPWDARAGYEPSLFESVHSVREASSTLTIGVTLWPRNESLFVPPPRGSVPLTAQQVASDFGPSQQQYNGIQAYFEHAGLTVVHTWPDRLALTVRGAPASVGQAFGTEILAGSWDGRSVTFPSTAPSLPAPFESQVAAVSGLSAGFSSSFIPLSPSAAGGPPDNVPAQGLSSTTMVTPADARIAYGISSLYDFNGTPTYAAGEGIALLLWGWGYDPQDLSTFFSNYFGGSYPLPQVTPYPVDGAPAPSSNAPNDPSGAPMELTLDMEWAGTMAPGASLDAVYAPDGPSSSNDYSPTDTSLEDALNTAVNDIPGVRVISMSFGGNDGNDTSFQAAFSMSFAAATQEGMTLVAASGDNGGDLHTGCAGPAAPQFPAASPQVLAVGGTTPVLAENALGEVTGVESQSAWNQSGGGYSTTYAAPSWQLVGNAAGPIGANGHRGIPDVSGPAAYNFLYYSGRGEWAAGTSFAAPMWAGLVAEMDALHGTPLGFLTPHLYSLGALEETGSGTPAGLTDVTSGGNCITQATSGWDAATGWGTPDATLLYAAISFTTAEVSFTSVPSSATPGGSVQAVVTVLNATSRTPLVGVPVSVVLDSGGYSGPCGGTLGMATPTTDANGSVSVRLGIPSCFLGSHATITATVLSNGYYGETSSGITVNLLGFAGFLAFVQYYPYNLLAFAVVIGLAVMAGWALGRRRRHRRAPDGYGPPPPPPTP